jgi:hypothetical protein
VGGRTGPDSGWEEFPATSRCRPLFDGAANIDEMDMPDVGAKGLTLRLFDPARKKWSLNWASHRTGTLFPPVFGRFDGDRGEFYGDDTHDGKDVRCGSSGRGAPTPPPAGNRRSPWTAVRPG